MTRPPAQAATPDSPLMEFLLGILASLLTAGGLTDPATVQAAAREAIDAYAPRNHAELLTVTQIVGLSLTALDNLRLSMGPDVTSAMKLRLRGNANALNRLSLRHAGSLEKSRSAVPPDRTGQAPSRQPAIAREQPPLSETKPDSEQWAEGMTAAAAELRSRAAHVTAAQRGTDQIWADVLTGVASELHRAMPASVKADLLGSTLMQRGPSRWNHRNNQVKGESGIREPRRPQTPL